MNEVISIPLGFTAEGVVILVRITFSHSVRPGMLQRLARLLDALAPLADEPLDALMGRKELEVMIHDEEECPNGSYQLTTPDLGHAGHTAGAEGPRGAHE